MTRQALLFIVLLAGCASARDPVAEVRARERQWLDAYEKRDASAMREILHDRFVITYPNGQSQTKADVLAFLEHHSHDTEGGPRFHTEDVTAHDGRGVVVLRGKVITERPGSRSVQRYTDTYVLEHGRWRVLASQLADSK